jgi:prevent-host-death family protein
MGMKEIGLTEAKRRFSELVERASKGVRIGITKYGVVVAVLQPVEKVALRAVFAGIEAIRRTSKKPPHVTVKSFIEESRM